MHTWKDEADNNIRLHKSHSEYLINISRTSLKVLYTYVTTGHFDFNICQLSLTRRLCNSNNGNHKT